MTDLLQHPGTLLEVLKGWYVLAAPAWLALTQFLKLAQPRITEFLTRLIHRVVETEDQTDDARLVSIVGSFRYWLLNELLDLLFRVKLPSLEDVRRIAAEKPTSNPTTYNSL
jgi:hypothetical protein